MTTPSKIAKTHFNAAMAECAATGQGEDAVARALMTLVIETYLKTRPPEDVRQELITASDNLDPDADHMFMRP